MRYKLDFKIIYTIADKKVGLIDLWSLVKTTANKAKNYNYLVSGSQFWKSVSNGPKGMINVFI